VYVRASWRKLERTKSKRQQGGHCGSGIQPPDLILRRSLAKFRGEDNVTARTRKDTKAIIWGLDHNGGGLSYPQTLERLELLRFHSPTRDDLKLQCAIIATIEINVSLLHSLPLYSVGVIREQLAQKGRNVCWPSQRRIRVNTKTRSRRRAGREPGRPGARASPRTHGQHHATNTTTVLRPL